jgi:lipopolysaccharide export system protein LptA
MTWQKKARLAIGAFVIVFVAIVIVALRTRKTVPQSGAVPERQDPKALVENPTGGHYSHTSEGRIVFSVKFGSQFTYPDGRTKFGNGIEVTSERNGRAFTVTSREAVIVQNGPDLKTAHFTGAVKLTSAGIEVTAEEATYDEAEGVVKVPGAVAFKHGRIEGTGVGATYDRNRDVLWLLDKAHITVAADQKGQGALEATSGAAGMARLEHYMRLTGHGQINAEGRLIDADEILIPLTDDNERVKMLQLRGNSHMSGGGSAGGAQAMSARDIDLTYADDGRTLQHSQLVENSVVQLPGSGGSAGGRIAGKTIDIAMAPDGNTVTNLNATENVQVDLPAEGDLPAKRIRSATLTATGAPGSGLQSFTFGGNVDYRETRAARRNAAAIDRVARSLALTVETKPGFGAVEQADFHGNVHFTDGPQVAADAQRALYHVAGDQIDLSSSGDPGPITPRVSDSRVTVEARTIELVLGTRKLKADTKVRSSMLPSTKKGTGATAAATAATPPGDAQQGRLPSLLKQDEAVTVTSNRLDYDGLAGRALYSGNARLWQGDTTVRGDAITVDDKTGNLEATGNVQTDMTLDQVDEKTGARKPTRTKGDAESFVYDDSKRLATYTVKAHMVGPAGDVSAEKLELFLKPAANELERAEGYGANGTVIVKETGRTASGARLTYTVKSETYLMTGTPVKVIETTPPDCREHVGTVVTFVRAVDTVSMSGNGVIRAVVTQIACPAETSSPAVKVWRRTETGEVPRRQAGAPGARSVRAGVEGATTENTWLVFEGGATQPARMHRPSNAARVSPRAAR